VNAIEFIMLKGDDSPCKARFCIICYVNQTSSMIKPVSTSFMPLLHVLYEEYGYDFSMYAEKHVHRRITDWFQKKKIKTENEAIELIQKDRQAAYSFISCFSIGVTEMFRDPLFYTAFRKIIIPILKTNPFIKIWYAGCATGEDVYSLAIMLKEEGVLNRCRIYGTDFNETFLQKARKGIYSYDTIKKFTSNYTKSGGNSFFSDYYFSQYDSVIFNTELKKNIVWANHNLVSDSVFSEVDVIICRNVLIYFNSELQNNVLQLFIDSLSSKGILCVGDKETIQFSTANSHFDTIDGKNGLYQLIL
jgi:chemotaxis protein methyltransferase CheR